MKKVSFLLYKTCDADDCVAKWYFGEDLRLFFPACLCRLKCSLKKNPKHKDVKSWDLTYVVTHSLYYTSLTRVAQWVQHRPLGLTSHSGDTDG